MQYAYVDDLASGDAADKAAAHHLNLREFGHSGGLLG
jgi:hypothetical protein